MARITTNATVASPTNITAAHAAPLATDATADIAVSINLATVKTVDALELAFAAIVRAHRGSGYLAQH